MQAPVARKTIDRNPVLGQSVYLSTHVWDTSTMAINIKNEETTAAVAKLAKITGLNMSEAIRQAVNEKLARLESREAQTDRILAIGRDCASRLPRSVRNSDHAEILYGPDGLPQ